MPDEHCPLCGSALKYVMPSSKENGGTPYHVSPEGEWYVTTEVRRKAVFLRSGDCVRPWDLLVAQDDGFPHTSDLGGWPDDPSLPDRANSGRFTSRVPGGDGD